MDYELDAYELDNYELDNYELDNDVNEILTHVNTDKIIVLWSLPQIIYQC